jgi:hypothetical protein
MLVRKIKVDVVDKVDKEKWTRVISKTAKVLTSIPEGRMSKDKVVSKHVMTSLDNQTRVDKEVDKAARIEIAKADRKVETWADKVDQARTKEQVVQVINQVKIANQMKDVKPVAWAQKASTRS